MKNPVSELSVPSFETKAKQEDELLSCLKLKVYTILIMNDMEIEKSFTKEDYRSYRTKALKIIVAIKKKATR